MCDSLQDVITVWIALDDMTEELGAKKLPPFFAIQYLDKLNDRIAKTGSVQTRKENLRKSGITFVVFTGTLEYVCGSHKWGDERRGSAQQFFGACFSVCMFAFESAGRFTKTG